MVDFHLAGWMRSQEPLACLIYLNKEEADLQNSFHVDRAPTDSSIHKLLQKDSLENNKIVRIIRLIVFVAIILETFLMHKEKFKRNLPCNSIMLEKTLLLRSKAFRFFR